MRFMLVFECDKSSKTDYLYYKPFIDKYLIDKYGPRKYGLEAEFTCGKTKMLGDSLLKKIGSFVKNTKEISHQDYAVILFVDVDTGSINDVALNNEIINVANENGFEIVWANKDVESVFLGNPIPKKQKTKKAEKFNYDMGKGNIDLASLSLNIKNPVNTKNSSNLYCVLDKVCK